MSAFLDKVVDLPYIPLGDDESVVLSDTGRAELGRLVAAGKVSLPKDDWRAHARPPEPFDPMHRYGAKRLSGVSVERPAPPRLGMLDPVDQTILFGPGDVGKGTLAAWMSVELAAAGERVLILDYENHPTEWARRISGLGGPGALEAVIWAGPLGSDWRGARGALWAAQESVRSLANDMDATVIVIDSIVIACCGADPMKPETAALYAGALQYIGLPALSLAHVTKEHALTYPFGSVFWHNLARVSWSMAKSGERAMLVNRKHNNYPHLGRFTVSTTWYEDLPREVSMRPYMAVLSERIDEVVGGRSINVSGIVELLNEDLDEDAEPVKENSVRTALTRGLKATLKRYTVTGTGKSAEWSRV